jgi:hypothetical protein
MKTNPPVEGTFVACAIPHYNVTVCSVAPDTGRDIHRMWEKSAFSLVLMCSTETMMSKDREQLAWEWTEEFLYPTRRRKLHRAEGSKSFEKTVFPT